MLGAIDLDAPWPVVARRESSVLLVVIGAGGTGSQLVPHLARLVWDFNQQFNEDEVRKRCPASLLIVDHDLVEEKNVRARQNFCPPEIGFPKAQVLANRYALAFGMKADEIGALVQPFSPDLLQRRYHGLTILVGCVDNAQARRDIAGCLRANSATSTPHTWYVDGGNGFDFGQVVCGTTATIADLRGCLHERICPRLPSPVLVAPALFEASAEEAARTETVKLSCGDLVLVSQGVRQSRTINTHIASLLYAYVEQLVYGHLTRLATYTNLSTLETHSVPVTPHTLSHLLDKPPAFFTMHPDGEEDDEGDNEEEDEDDEEDEDEDDEDEQA